MKPILLRKPMILAWLLLLGALLVKPSAHGAAASGLSLAKQLNEAFVEVAEKVSPTVAIIEVEGKAMDMETDSSWMDMFPPQLRKQFEEYLERRREGQTPRRRSQPHPGPTGQGSGVVIREDGYIVTNGHVVEGAEKITVKFKNGRQFKATLQGVDPESDVAVLKIDARGLPFSRFADSSRTRVGEFAIAIGAPFSLDYTVTVGHVSAKGRQVLSSRELFDQDFIQTDASINPGNSGGPLVNLDGEIIGINTMIRGLNTGIGFAVPANLVRQVSDVLIRDGKFTRAWLGVGIATLGESAKFRDHITGVDRGVVVESILPDGPAARSTLEPGDVITSVDGQQVATVQELRNEVRGKQVGGNVSLDVVRDGRKIKVQVQPGALPENQFTVNRAPRKGPEEEGVSGFGLKVQALTPKLASQFALDAKTGVVVTEVEDGSPAEAAGIKPGEVITRVNRKPVATLNDYREAIKGANLKTGVSFSITGEGGRRLEVLKDDAR